jgi:hypothetical protein
MIEATVEVGPEDAMMNSECEETITSTGNTLAALPAPTGIRTSGNHRSHCA